MPNYDLVVKERIELIKAGYSDEDIAKKQGVKAETIRIWRNTSGWNKMQAMSADEAGYQRQIRRQIAEIKALRDENNALRNELYALRGATV